MFHVNNEMTQGFLSPYLSYCVNKVRHKKCVSLYKNGLHKKEEKFLRRYDAIIACLYSDCSLKYALQ